MDLVKIGNHTHAVLGAIALIQMLQPVAGEAVAIATESGLARAQLRTVLDPAGEAGFRFAAVVAPAPWAGLFVPGKRPAEAAIHAARGNQCGWDRSLG